MTLAAEPGSDTQPLWPEVVRPVGFHSSWGGTRTRDPGIMSAVL